MKASFNYTWEALDAGRRSNDFLLDLMRHMYLHHSATSVEALPFPSRADYAAYDNGYDGRPFFSEGATVSGDDGDNGNDDNDEGDEIGDEILE